MADPLLAAVAPTRCFSSACHFLSAVEGCSCNKHSEAGKSALGSWGGCRRWRGGKRSLRVSRLVLRHNKSANQPVGVCFASAGCAACFFLSTACVLRAGDSGCSCLVLSCVVLRMAPLWLLSLSLSLSLCVVYGCIFMPTLPVGGCVRAAPCGGRLFGVLEGRRVAFSGAVSGGVRDGYHVHMPERGLPNDVGGRSATASCPSPLFFFRVVGTLCFSLICRRMVCERARCVFCCVVSSR